MKKIFYIIASSIIVFTSCKKGLDYVNNNAINPSEVWTDSATIQAYLSDIYGGSMPGWPLGQGNSSDEGINSAKSLGNYQMGVISAAANYVNLNYAYIDKCNFFMDQLAALPAGVLSDATKAQYTGEAKFWRAWTYWSMVSQLGGIPLILHTQNATDITSLQVPRNKTSECIAQIVKDLDSATLLLPGSYSGVNYGRITSVAALGLKGRILMWYASPLFNPTNDQTRWQNAFNATQAAVNAANANGYGLLSNYRAIWYSGNKEQIMTNQFYYPDHYMNFAAIRPLPFTNGATGNDQPLLPLLLAYPKRDGSPMQFDKTQLSDPVYNAQLVNDFYTNRDDRFYATVYFGGTPYPTPDVLPGQPSKCVYWTAWQWTSPANASFVLSIPGGYSNIDAPVENGNDNGVTGFYDRKGLDTTLTGQQIVSVAAGAKSWWSPMRYAELLMNYGECANETGDASDALNVLYQIRARANIQPGSSGNYGVTAASQADIRTAFMNERMVEFAFEGFRFNDLRRWKRFDILNSEGTRHGLLLMLNNGAPLPSTTDNVMTASVRQNFSMVYVDNLDGSANYKYNLDLNHWFYPLNPAQLSLEPTVLLQNNEWGGTFDPLQ
ncbi:MAG TPA: RagB/SusD family nutrient uptake outer membrane protein [Puia sp.]|nr:RagB/SusD family nutrient uptake outer membrane protein [Puia sp.]